jgi:SRSO17 transposase
MVVMTPNQLRKLDRELTSFLDEMITGMGRPERRSAMGHYITGLLLDGERKSIQPLAARLVKDPLEADAMRQRLQDCVSLSPWSDEELFHRLAAKLDRELPGIEALVVDDTGFAKKGEYSVGVARQYSGTLGRTDNCQVATSLHLAGEKGSGCIGFRLYLGKEWMNDRERCQRAGVPDGVEFKKKWEIALDLIDTALAWGIEKRPVLADGGYGEIPEFREGLSERGIPYAVGVPGNHLIWPPDTDPRPPKPTGKAGRPAMRWRDGDAAPIKIAKLVEGIPRERYKTVTWREGTRGKMTSKFLAYRVRPAEGHTKGKLPAEEQWLLCEWPSADKEPKFHLATLPAHFSLRALVRVTKLRWRVERDYQDLKGEIGLDHFEGRTWRGFHHHATLCAVAHGFLALRRALFPPEQSEMDAAGSTTAPSTDSPPPHRLVPAMCAPRGWPLAAPGGIAVLR